MSSRPGIDETGTKHRMKQNKGKSVNSDNLCNGNVYKSSKTEGGNLVVGMYPSLNGKNFNIEVLGRGTVPGTGSLA